MLRVLVAAVAVLFCAAPAWAQDTMPNPFVAAYGWTGIANIEVRYTDGVLPSHQDSAAAAYAERKLGEERRAAFEAFAQPRGLTRGTSAERMAEYLAESDLYAFQVTPPPASAPAPEASAQPQPAPATQQ